MWSSLRESKRTSNMEAVWGGTVGDFITQTSAACKVQADALKWIKISPTPPHSLLNFWAVERQVLHFVWLTKKKSFEVFAYCMKSARASMPCAKRWMIRGKKGIHTITWCYVCWCSVFLPHCWRRHVRPNYFVGWLKKFHPITLM